MKNLNEEIIVEEILEKYNLWEKIIVKYNKKLFIKTYKIGITYGFNKK
ncbi:MAG: hypothetical protein ACLS95_00425 [Clostridia bacterium]